MTLAQAEAGPVLPGAAMAQYRQAVGTWISTNRSYLKLTANDVGRAIGVSPSTVRNWEHGIGNLSMFHAECLRGYFDAEWARFDKRHVVTAEELAVRQIPLPELAIVIPRGAMR